MKYVRLAYVCVLASILIALGIKVARAHSWYSEKVDPVFKNACCGGTDCAKLDIVPGVLQAVPEGYRITLTLEQTRKINPWSMFPLDAVIAWERVQPSEDGNYHLCIAPTMRNDSKQGVFCFFAPPST